MAQWAARGKEVYASNTGSWVPATDPTWLREVLEEATREW